MNKIHIAASLAAIALFISVLMFLYVNDSKQTYVIFTVDTEQDLPPYLKTYKGMEEGIPKLLDLFEKYNVKATFFVVGETAKKYNETVLNIAERGHEIGMHGLEHEKFNELNNSEKERRIKEASQILENITGMKAVSFRAPYHSTDKETQQILEANGYLVDGSGWGVPNWIDKGFLSLPVSLTPQLFYPSSFYNRSWIDGYKFASNQIGNNNAIVIGMHPWEFVEMPDVKGAEEYTRTSGNYSYQRLEELLDYLKHKNVRYLTVKEYYAIKSADNAAE